MRIHNPSTQRHVLENILGVPTARVDATFGHLLESLGSGCPPHAGFALGVDRCVRIGRLRLPTRTCASSPIRQFFCCCCSG